TLLGDVLGKVGAARRYLSAGAPDSAYAQKAGRQLEDMAWNAAVAAKGNDDFQRRWFGTYLGLSSSRPALDRLADLLSGKSSIEGLKINQDLRWSIISRLNRYDYPGAAELVKAEQEKDKSDSGQAAALVATVVRP